MPSDVLLVTVTVPVFMIAPPLEAALSPEKVLLITWVLAPLAIAPPSPDPVGAWLPEKVLLVILRVPPLALAIAPPVPALLSEKVLSVTTAARAV